MSNWKHRLGAFGSPLIEAPGYRVLFLLVIVGVLLICLLPEAAFVLPAPDAIGLDIATILVALELRHYLTSTARFTGVPRIPAICRGGPAQLVVRCRQAAHTDPSLWPYACMWPLIWIRAGLGKR